MLETSLNQFPTGTENYVAHAVLKDYIQDTALKTGVHDITQYDTDVKNISKEGTKWNVDTATLQSNEAGRTVRKTSHSVGELEL